MIDPKDLQFAGYKEFPVAHGHLNKLADRAFQMRLMSGGKTLYFITVWCYDHDKNPHDAFTHRWGWLAEAVLYTAAGDWLELSYNSLNERGIKAMEQVFATAYKALGCVPDIHNND